MFFWSAVRKDGGHELLSSVFFVYIICDICDSFSMNGKEDSPFTETALVAILECALEEKFGQIRETMSELQLSVNFLSDRFDNVLQRLSNLETNCDSVKNENRHLKAEVLRLSGILERHSTELNEIEQYSRRECVEISGLPVEVEENTTDLAIKVASLMDLDLDERDISVSHRLSQRRTSDGATSREVDHALRFPKVIVKFVRRETKELFYQGRKCLKNKNTRDIGLSRISDNKIYVSESLSPRNRELFKDSLKFKRDYHFNYIWTQTGRIFLRKDRYSPPRLVTSKRDLHDLQELSR